MPGLPRRLRRRDALTGDSRCLAGAALVCAASGLVGTALAGAGIGRRVAELERRHARTRRMLADVGRRIGANNHRLTRDLADLERASYERRMGPVRGFRGSAGGAVPGYYPAPAGGRR